MTDAVAPDRIGLDAVNTLAPIRGEVVRVERGSVFVFAVDDQGRRAALATLGEGEALVGCAPTADGMRLLVTGVPGTEVSRHEVDGSTDRGLLEQWAATLGSFLADGRWPGRLVDARGLEGVLAPGEHVAAVVDGASVAWVAVTSGSARVCGARGATVGPMDGPVPLTRRMWLTAGVRCWVKAVEPPAATGQWAAALDALGCAALGAAGERQIASDREVLARLQPQLRRRLDDTRASIDVLAAAASRKPERSATSAVPPEAAAALLVARESGLSTEAISIDRIVAEIGSGRGAVDAVAGACGARARPVALEDGWSSHGGRPLVAWITPPQSLRRRVVALVPGRAWAAIDVATGERTRVDDDVLRSLDRRAFELVPVLPDRSSTLSDLRSVVGRGTRRDVVWVAALSAAIGAVSFAAPLLLGRVAQQVVDGRGAARVGAAFVALFLVVVAGACWTAVRSFCMLRLRAASVVSAAGALWDRMMRQSAAWHSERPFGDRMAQATAVTAASTVLPDSAVARCLDVSMVIGSMAAVATTDWTLAAGLGVSLVAQSLLLVRLLRRSAEHAEARLDASSAVVGRLQELLRSVNRIRLAGAESRALLGWARLQARVAVADNALQRAQMQQGLIISVWPTATLIVIVAVAATTGAGFAAVITAQAAVAAASAAISAAAGGANAVVQAGRSLARSTPVLVESPEGGPGTVHPGELQGAIEAHEVTFRYGHDLPVVLDRVSISVRPGEHVAIVGPSGCGKTTLMRVLLGLDTPESGVIAVDGRDLALLDRPAVRRQVGSVLQSSNLLPNTIRGNVDMGRGLPGSALWAALDMAGIGDDVRRMPMGLDTPVADGAGTISGGQRQRILIARALAGRPRVLVLDEATSALDNVTQAAVVESLERLRITRLVVAHRLSTIRHADRVVVMDSGRVVDEGTYDELMSRDGVFRRMAARQQA